MVEDESKSWSLIDSHFSGSDFCIDGSASVEAYENVGVNEPKAWKTIIGIYRTVLHSNGLIKNEC